MNVIDNTYKQVVSDVLRNGQFKENRTGVDTISKFAVSYSIDVSDEFPLLTTKKLDEGRWESIVYELLWYLSGDYHIRDLQEHTSIWENWADGNGNLDTAYGRFWRRYPMPNEADRLPGESWPDEDSKYVSTEDEISTFDQIRHVIDNLKENPNSRRHIVNAWHPANAAESQLPPCHYSFIFNVQNEDTLNLHLTQRSGDVALGVPFNIASYSLLLKIVAQRTAMEVGEFHHTIADAHIYCGEGERSEWWQENIDRVPDMLDSPNLESHVENIREEAPEDPDNLDHIPGLLEQMTKTSYNAPNVEIADKDIDELEFDDFELQNYNSHESIQFGVAE